MTISDDFRDAQRQLHENPNYGVAWLQYAPFVMGVIEEFGAKNISDYGAEKRRLKSKVK